VKVLQRDIVQELIDIPEEIKKAQEHVLDKSETLERVKAALKDREAELLLNGTIDGKNAEQRAAQLRMHTKAEREAMMALEAELNREKVHLDYSYNRLKALRAIARILGGEVD
jgi:hypothetical protein